ncbi:MAG TPA: hypothetical protein VMR75_02285 [Candidatus Saccharimonadales bacterium]|nr:hypothetical protein [Candidatus Saccharimonadales bacterium]
MYSGFITSKRTLPAVGVHQRFDRAAYRLLGPYLDAGGFATARQITRFEGVNGPDGLKAKSPGQHQAEHLYNPVTGRGDIPGLISSHYDTLVVALREQDRVRMAFDAAWLAHYICDGLTPAHHFPLNTRLAAYGANAQSRPKRFLHAAVASGKTPAARLKNNWALWGGKGLLSTHFNFEIGVAAALVGRRIQVRFDPAGFATAQKLGPVSYFKEQAADIARLQMYENFYEHGWNAELGRLVLRRLAPQTVQTIAVVWLSAYLEAGLQPAQPLPVARG